MNHFKSITLSYLSCLFIFVLSLKLNGCTKSLSSCCVGAETCSRVLPVFRPPHWSDWFGGCCQNRRAAKHSGRCDCLSGRQAQGAELACQLTVVRFPERPVPLLALL